MRQQTSPLGRILGCSLVLALAAPAYADFTITDFSASPVNLVFPDVAALPGGTGTGPANTASVVGPVLNITPGVLSNLGCAWVDTAETVSNGFVTEFTFEFLPSPSGAGGGSGDGLAFVIQNDPLGLGAIGNHASAIGYGGFANNPTRGINNSLALEIDDFSGNGQNDPNGNHLSLHTMGAGDNTADHALASLAQTTNIPFFGQGSGVHTVRIEYDGANLLVFFDDPNNPVLGAAVDLATILGGNDAFIGFTGSGGGAYQVENVTSWTFTSGPPGGVELCDNGTDDDLDGDIDCADADCVLDPVCVAGGNAFYRGDNNGDGGVNIADAVYYLGNLFPNGGPPNPIGCLEAADANADGGLNIADAVTLLNALFVPASPPLPFPNVTDGCNPLPGGPLGCDTFDACP